MSLSDPIVSEGTRSPSLDQATDISAVREQDENNHPDNWIPSARFWDTLPRIRLTRRALDELNHRVRQQDLQPQTSAETAPPLRRSRRLRQLARQNQLRLLQSATPGVGKPGPDLQRFSRGGGPDLSSIRGYLDPAMVNPGQSMTRLTVVEVTASSKRTGPYDANYQMKLAQDGIFLIPETDENRDTVLPANHDEIMTRLKVPRKSLSPSRFPEREFQRFQRQTGQEILESETMRQSMATIEGSREQFFSRMGGLFNNLESFDPDIAMAVPDLYDGAEPISIDNRVLDDLDQYIVPNTDKARPAAPNFFLEGKSRKGRADVAMRQAAHTGAIGARAMMSLQSYPTRASQYDGNAYSFTSTYHDGQLKMYTTHATAPKTPDDHPSYYMTQLSAHAMTGDSDTFRRGATFYRNARNLAKEQRDSLIQQANQAARERPHNSTANRSSTKRVSSHRVGRESSPHTDSSPDVLALDTSSQSSESSQDSALIDDEDDTS